jgi:peptidoglycan hydrolase-like protein with peptidoglycan-binding domain
VCEARSGSSNAAASLILGADTGDLEEGSSIKVRFSGGGFEHTVSGIVFGTKQEEGITGVSLDVDVKDPLWKALTSKNSIDYQIPGYSSSKLKLKQGHTKIRQFIRACRDSADLSGSGASTNAKPKPVKKAEAKKEPKKAEPKKAASGGSSQKEAFNSAKELGTLEAWEAFITNFPTGFRAELARAYLKRIASEAPKETPTTTTAPPPPPPPVEASAPPPPPPPSPADISITEIANQESCKGGNFSSYTIVATNNGGTAFSSQLVIANSLSPRGATLTSTGNEPWFCQAIGGGAVCTNANATIEPGASTNLSLTFKLPRKAGGSVTSCASVSWGVAPSASGVIDVQQALNQQGFNVGRPDGQAGRKTVSAARSYQTQNGLQATVEIDLPLLISLFTVPGAGDADPNNDQACAGSAVTAAAPVTYTPRPQIQYCGGGRVRDRNGNCACPATFPYWTGKTCIPRRTHNCTGGRYYSKKRKLCLCPSRKPYWYNDRCYADLNDCPGDSVRIGSQCIKENEPVFETTRGGAGIGCPAGSFRVGTSCVQTSQAPVFGNPNKGGPGRGGNTKTKTGGG